MRSFRRLRPSLSLVGAPLVASLVVVFAGGSVSLGCASEAILTTDHLPVKRVIVYRNGVAYFERGGHVDSGEVRFKMKQSEVGDFLATLAVMEKEGSSVRAAAFPLDHDDPEPTDPPEDGTVHDKREPLTPQQEADAADRKKGLRTVVLSLDGKEHDLQVGYVAESPVWRPSYRLVVHTGGAADLQAWGIVQNVSGEDWKAVHLTLVAGAPLAFQTDLGTSVIPERPTVSDNGEVVAVVPHGETSLSQMPASTPMAPPPPPPVVMASPMLDAPKAKNDHEEERRSAESAGLARHKKAGPRQVATRSAPGGAVAATPPPEPAAEPYANAPSPVVPSGPRDLRSLAAVAAQGGSTKYDLPNPVTVPDKSATMVMLLSRSVQGEAIFLFAPAGGVSDSDSHPFRVAQFTNNTGGVLERGPIAVFEDGSFLGQGLVDPLPDGATATVPFALERSIAIDVDRRWDDLGARVAKIDNGELTVERDNVKQTRYRIRNGGEKAVKVLVKHLREGSSRLFSPPKDTVDNVGTGTALVPAKVEAHATLELNVDERTPMPRLTDWFTPLAETAVKALLADPKGAQLNAPMEGKLQAAWKVRGEIVEKLEALEKVRASEGALLQSADETRRNLRAIERNRVADALRATLTQRLTETSLKIDVLTKQKVELDAKLAELRIRFKEALRDGVYVAPPVPRL